MHVLYVEASSGGVLGGSLTGLYHLVRGLDRTRFTPSIVLYEHKPIEASLAQLGVPVHRVSRRRLAREHALRRYEGYHRVRKVDAIRDGIHVGRHAARLLLEELPSAWQLARVIRTAGADVVHLGNGVRANFDGILAALLTRTPIICHVKGFEKYGPRERWASRRTRTMVCMTQAILDYCGAHGLRPADARVVYDAVDESWLQPSRPVRTVRAELGVPADAVEALAALAGLHPRVHCLIVGGTHRAGAGYAEELRRRAADLGLNPRIHFTGYREDVVDVMNAADVIVHASIRPEPFGRVILEGMLLAKPVIATAAGGVLELIEHERTGFLVPPGDVPALAHCLAGVLSAPEAAAAIGAAAQAFARQRFSLARHVAEMTGIYEAAVAGHA
jgi:glycosyltransferase involved in cell wall biosynthesis